MKEQQVLLGAFQRLCIRFRFLARLWLTVNWTSDNEEWTHVFCVEDSWVVAHDLLEDRYIDDVTGIFFLCFVRNGAQLWKFLWDYFRTKASESLAKTFSRSYLQTKKNGETETKKAQIDSA